MSTEPTQTSKNTSLTDIIKNDAGIAVSVFSKFLGDVLHLYTVKNFVIGAMHGFYTPFLLATGIRRMDRLMDETVKKEFQTGERRFLVEGVSDPFGQSMIALATQVTFVSYLIQQGRCKEYVGALLVTNVADYLYEANQRRKTQ